MYSQEKNIAKMQKMYLLIRSWTKRRGEFESLREEDMETGRYYCVQEIGEKESKRQEEEALKTCI
jgi:hypothetical protein